jgi:hypothetical protein
MFTGSGIPMRFADLDGTLIDCYQVPTQITDESGISNYSTFINSLLDKAKGPEGYYGVFCANMHTDVTNSTGSTAIVNSAIARQIPVVSAKQMLDWLDYRNNSAFKSISWSGNELSFAVTTGTGSRNLKAMLPTTVPDGALSLITANGSSIPFTVETIKGIEYAFFNATPANYKAIYGTTTLAMTEITDFLEMKMEDENKVLSNREVKLTVFPNPFSEEGTVEFLTTGDVSRVSLNVFDVKGNNVGHIYEGPSRGNEVNSFSLGQLNLLPGVYFIRLATPEKTVTSKQNNQELATFGSICRRGPEFYSVLFPADLFLNQKYIGTPVSIRTSPIAASRGRVRKVLTNKPAQNKIKIAGTKG